MEWPSCYSNSWIFGHICPLQGCGWCYHPCGTMETAAVDLVTVQCSKEGGYAVLYNIIQIYVPGILHPRCTSRYMYNNILYIMYMRGGGSTCFNGHRIQACTSCTLYIQDNATIMQEDQHDQHRVNFIYRYVPVRGVFLPVRPHVYNWCA